MRPDSRRLDDNEHERPLALCRHDAAADAGNGTRQHRRGQGARRSQETGGHGGKRQWQWQRQRQWPRRRGGHGRPARSKRSAEHRHDDACPHDRDAELGRRRHLPLHPRRRAGRRCSAGRRHGGADRTLPDPLHRRAGQVGCDGHDRTAGRFGHGQHPDHGHLRPGHQRVDHQRPEDLLHQRQAGAGRVRRHGCRLGHGGQEGRPRRHEALCGRGRHARRDHRQGGGEAGHPRQRHGCDHLRQRPHPGGQRPGRRRGARPVRARRASRAR
jgi:hypothetical protein